MPFLFFALVLRSLFWISNYVYWCKITASVAFQPLLIQFTFIFESWIMVWLILNNSVLQSPSPSPFEPNHLLLPAPKLCLFGRNDPLSCTGPPRWPSSLPPCVSLPLCASIGEQWEQHCSGSYWKEDIYNGVFLSPTLSPLKSLGTQHCPGRHS